MTVADANKKLQRALRRLVPEQGEVARRNTRAKVRHYLAMLRHAMDEEFPLAKRPPRPRQWYKPVSYWNEAVVVHSNSEVAKLISAGIKPSQHLGNLTMPRWAIHLSKATVQSLRKAKRDVGFRRQLLATHRLLEEEG